MKRKFDFWYLITGLVIGMGIGLLVTWVLAPVHFTDTTPSSLRIENKDEYRYLIASAFAANGDLMRARARLGLLQDPDPFKALGEQAQRMIATGAALPEVQILADLSTALQIQPTETVIPIIVVTNTAIANNTVSFTPPVNTLVSPDQTTTKTSTTVPSASATKTSSAVPSASSTKSLSILPSSSATKIPSTLPSASATHTMDPTATFEPKPLSTIAPLTTRTITPTISAPFKITKVTPFCEPNQPGLLQIILTNSAGKPAAGIEVVVTWSDGEEHFFTGLKPEMGYGYADFVMAENVDYALSLSAGGVQVPNLQVGKCGNVDSNAYPGGIRLEFFQP